MKLSEVVDFELNNDDVVVINDIQSDSRKIKSGDLFIAISGFKTDGSKYIKQAIQNGAVAVLIDETLSLHENVDIPIIPIKDLTQKLGIIASNFYSNPSHKMDIIGVTGTNGKSSTCHYIAEILNALSCSCGVIGTLGVGIKESYVPTNNTTPGSIELNKNLLDLYNKNTKTVAMEVSSHALMQYRVTGIQFDTAVFTNLTNDHLDYHKSLEEYWNAKLRLFLDFKLKHVIINLDDVYGRKLLSLLPKKIKIIGYTLEDESKYDFDVIKASHIQYTEHGISTKLTSSFGTQNIEIPLIGKFNLSNTLAAIASCISLGYEFTDILSVIDKITNVPGRMQYIQSKEKPLVVVDYAHTPDAIYKALEALKYYCKGKLWCVFGCGGDRDKTKRPKMLQAALKFSDRVILTQDNPRTEDPQQIMQDILEDNKESDNIIIKMDRKSAIYFAVNKATKEDIILVAGKGHENRQIIGTTIIPFSDIDVVKNCFANKGV